ERGAQGGPRSLVSGLHVHRVRRRHDSRPFRLWGTSRNGFEQGSVSPRRSDGKSDEGIAAVNSDKDRRRGPGSQGRGGIEERRSYLLGRDGVFKAFKITFEEIKALTTFHPTLQSRR